jgi:hypothetical protein
MIFSIAAFASVVSFNFELSQPVPAVIFSEKDLDSNKLQLITSSESISWDDLDFKVEPEPDQPIELPSGPAQAGQTLDCPNWQCTITVVHTPSNAIVGIYKFDGPQYESDDEADGSDEHDEGEDKQDDDEDETDESEETDETDESDDSDDPDDFDDIEGAIQFDIYKITPQTLNLRSSGRWITFHLSLPVGNYAADVDISTILLNDIISVDEDTPSPDAESPKFMVKFDRQEVIAILSPGDNVEVTITGLFNDGTEWEGTDYIKVT